MSYAQREVSYASLMGLLDVRRRLPLKYLHFSGFIKWEIGRFIQFSVNKLKCNQISVGNELKIQISFSKNFWKNLKVFRWNWRAKVLFKFKFLLKLKLYILCTKRNVLHVQAANLQTRHNKDITKDYHQFGQKQATN